MDSLPFELLTIIFKCLSTLQQKKVQLVSQSLKLAIDFLLFKEFSTKTFQSTAVISILAIKILQLSYMIIFACSPPLLT